MSELCRNSHRNCHQDIIDQIKHENNLEHNRMTWVLQINGFLFATLALLKKDADKSIYYFVSYILPIVGIAISMAGFYGIRAAHTQKEYLKGKWHSLQCNCCVRPFGARETTILGRTPSLAIPVVLAFSWLFFLSMHAALPN